MSQSPARIAKRHGLPTEGLGGELVHDMIEDARSGMRGWQGVVPARFVNAEPVQVLGGGSQVLLTFDLPEGSIQLAVPTVEAVALAEKIRAATPSLIVP